ncbi:AzlC family ABC transporter permease [Phosphitispora sp. TUW77]|uniref:AzlC family ABC transporter permease n=1 Tax=Phosphitispora sp. TUW77 TaxID=3152361 RepID=UPI003AB83C8B
MSKANFFKGAQKSFPIMVGYMPLGLAFGIIAREKGLTVIQAALMSLTSFTGSGQFIAVGLLSTGAGISAILLTNFLVNLRYLLFSASMAPFVRKMPSIVQAVLAFGITDETFALNMAEFNQEEADRDFILGVNIFSHFSWTANSALGAAVGNLIPDINRFGVNFALPAMFIALLIWQVKDRNTLWVAVISGMVSIILAMFTRNSVNIIAATVIAATIGVIICRCRQKSMF